MPPAVVIAGVRSGVGKTTIASGIMGALARRGRRVQPFKAGPDYIDPSYHRLACGVPSRNLDTWLLPHPVAIELFHRAAARADIAVIEGVMGLYDGHSSLHEDGSTAELAKLLRAPVILIADAGKVARSVAAEILGYQQLTPPSASPASSSTAWAAPATWNSASPRSKPPPDSPSSAGSPAATTLPSRNAISDSSPPWKAPWPLNGTTPSMPRLSRPSTWTPSSASPPPPALPPLFPRTFPPQFRPTFRPRHSPLNPALRAPLSRWRKTAPSPSTTRTPWTCWPPGAPNRPLLASGRRRPPPGAGGVYLGGGFPELFAPELAQNQSMLASLRRAIAAGRPVYAECGGLMYLGRSLSDLDGRRFPMAGAIPVVSSMTGRRLHLGYREVAACADGPLLRAGESVRGHEFHWSVLQEPPTPPAPPTAS